MKKIFALLVMMITVFGVSKGFAQSATTDTFKVYGNCNMCKKRIEKAATVDGVTKREWNVSTKIMTVSYDASKISKNAIQQQIAASGHDTEKVKAADEVYSKLPGCCRYDRNASSSNERSHHQ